MERLNEGHRLSRGYAVAWFLNEEKNTVDRMAFLEVFKLCCELDGFRHQLDQSMKAMKAEKVNQIIAQQVLALTELNAILRKFQFVPALRGPDPYTIIWTGRAGQDDERNAIPTASFVQAVLETTEDGTLERVRQCLCGRWFFAQTTKKIVCSDACRFQKFKEGNEKTFNKERAAYMRKYRKNPRVKKAQKKRGGSVAKTKAR
jgi:hypothetical protein